MKKHFLALLLCCLTVPPVIANSIHQSKPIELVLWHGMAGHLGNQVRQLANDFNQSQSEYVVKPVYKGNYIETLTSFAAAFRAHQPPAMVQIFEVGTALMLSPKGIIKPVHELMREQNMSLPEDDFIPSIRAFYSRNGQLMGMPFNLSAPALYYNKDILAKVGYNQDNFPKTWAEMEVLATTLKKGGYDCTYTTAYPGWVLFESFLAIHGLPIAKTKPMRAVFNTPQLISHYKRLKRWHELKYFRYGGRVDDSTVLFTSGICPLFSQSSGAFNSLSGLVPFRLGVSMMPLDTEISSVRHANVAGGAALWAVSGQSSAHYQGIARFFAFIAKPETQKRWHEHTGYLPIGLTGVYSPIVQNSQHPSLSIARVDLQLREGEKPFRHFGPQNQIRSVNDEMLEALFVGLMSPEEAVNAASARADHILLRFARNNVRK